MENNSVFQRNEEEKKEWRRICKILVPTWKRLIIYYMCKWLNVYYESQPPFHLNMKGEKYDLVNGKLIKKSTS